MRRNGDTYLEMLENTVVALAKKHLASFPGTDIEIPENDGTTSLMNPISLIELIDETKKQPLSDGKKSAIYRAFIRLSSHPITFSATTEMAAIAYAYELTAVQLLRCDLPPADFHGVMKPTWTEVSLTAGKPRYVVEYSVGKNPSLRVSPIGVTKEEAVTIFVQKTEEAIQFHKGQCAVLEESIAQAKQL